MRWWRRLAFRVRALLGRRRMDRDLREEVDFHLEMETRKHQAAGLSREAARREAVRRFGGVDRYRERTRATWGASLPGEVTADLRFALRQLRRRPAFALLTLGTLAVGLGTTAALSGVVRSLLLRPLPYANGERMVAFWQPFDWRASEFDALRELELESMDGLAAYTLDGAALQSDGGSAVLLSGLVTPDFFDVLGATPLMGRAFRPEDHAPGAAEVALVSHGLWRQELGGAPDVVGRRVELDGRAVTVVGVMPEAFFFPFPEVRLWRPLEMDRASSVYRGNGWLVMAGRLRPGVGPGSAAVARDLERMTATLGERFDYPPDFDRTRGAAVEPLRDWILGETGPALRLLMGAVALLLLAACSNVAALLVARTSDRAPELAVRAGMGAARGRLARQLLTEGAVLGLLGGLLGALLAAALHGALASALPTSGGMDGLLTLEWPVLVALAGLSAAVGLGVALVPLRGVLGGRLTPALGGARPAGGAVGSQRLQAWLVAAQVVLAVTLVSGAGLLVRSVGRLLDVELGVRPAGAVVADVYLGPRTQEERRRTFVELASTVGAGAGVTAAGTINRLPLRERGGQGSVRIEDRVGRPESELPIAYWRAVTPGTFDALGTRLLRGRGFDGGDRVDATAVTVVSQSFADMAWPGEDPLGRRLAPVGMEGDAWVTVVGVVEDVRYEGPTREPPMALYRPLAQVQSGPNVTLVVRAPDREPALVLAAVRGAALELDGTAAVHRTSTFDQVLKTSIARPLRLRSFLLVFGALALLLGMVGVYGVVAYAVSRRTRELGVRMALGADAGRLVRGVVGRGMTPVVVGALGGLAVSLVAGRALASFLFGVPAADPLSLGAAAALILVAGGGAAAWPALRAGRIDPVRALRAE